MDRMKMMLVSTVVATGVSLPAETDSVEFITRPDGTRTMKRSPVQLLSDISENMTQIITTLKRIDKNTEMLTASMKASNDSSLLLKETNKKVPD